MNWYFQHARKCWCELLWVAEKQCDDAGPSTHRVANLEIDLKGNWVMDKIWPWWVLVWYLNIGLAFSAFIVCLLKFAKVYYKTVKAGGQRGFKIARIKNNWCIFWNRHSKQTEFILFLPFGILFSNKFFSHIWFFSIVYQGCLSVMNGKTNSMHIHGQRSYPKETYFSLPSIFRCSTFRWPWLASVWKPWIANRPRPWS